MGSQVSAWVDDEVYEEILDRQDRTDESMSKIASEYIRKGAPINDETQNAIPDGGTLRGGFWQAIGQSLFVAGFIVALLAPTSFLSGVGMSMFGLGLMLWTNIQTHMQAGETLGEATKTTLGLN